MTPEALAALGVRVTVEDGELVLSAAPGVITPELRARVGAAREMIISLAQRGEGGRQTGSGGAVTESFTAPPPHRSAEPRPSGRCERSIAFSLFFFASAGDAEDPYRLLRACARFADNHGFEAVWTPERHFHPLGGHFPNPAVTAAMLAVETTRLAIRAGSVVLPLHDPLRVAEEWAMVDRLSGGRVGLGIASGWHADDFVLAPDSYGDRKQRMLAAIETLQALWRDETVPRRGGAGNELAVRVYPRPVQPALPLWLTSLGSIETFETAGTLGANVMTALLGQELPELTLKIAAYRAARAAAGHAGPGRVTCMVHTHLGADAAEVRARVKRPFCEYLMGTLDLVAQLASSMGATLDPRRLTAEDREALLDHAFARYADTSALFGTPDSVRPLVEGLHAAGVDELGCLVDFGLPEAEVLAGLEAIDALRLTCVASTAGGPS